MWTPQHLQHQPTAAAVLCVEVADTVQMLAQQPQDEAYEVTISQVVGEPCKQAWEILPLTITDVAKATRLDPVYGKLFNAVRSGNLDTTDNDISKFNGVFTNLYIGNEVLYFGTIVVTPGHTKP